MDHSSTMGSVVACADSAALHGPPASAAIAVSGRRPAYAGTLMPIKEASMAFINSDGSESTKDSGQLGIEQDGSIPGLVAVSLKEGLGRRANRLGGASSAASAALTAITNTGLTQLCQTAPAGAGMRHHVTLISLLLVGGTPGTDWAWATVQWNQDDGAHTAAVFLAPNQPVTLALDGQIVTAQNGTVTISAQAGTAAAMKCAAGVAAVLLPNA